MNKIDLKQASRKQLEEECARIERELKDAIHANPTPLDQDDYPKDFSGKFDKEKHIYLRELREELKKRKSN